MARITHPQNFKKVNQRVFHRQEQFQGSTGKTMTTSNAFLRVREDLATLQIPDEVLQGSAPTPASIKSDVEELAEWEERSLYKVSTRVKLMQEGLPKAQLTLGYDTSYQVPRPINYIDPSQFRPDKKQAVQAGEGAPGTALVPVPETQPETKPVTPLKLAQVLIPLTYEEGYAVSTSTGLPFWERIEGEDSSSYRAFKQYRDQRYISGVRSIDEVAYCADLSPALMWNISDLYHWRYRAQAYDDYQKLVRSGMREVFQLDMETRHQRAGKELFSLAETWVENNLSQIKPKDAIKLLEVASDLERVSLGLDKVNGNKNPSVVVNVKNQSTNFGDDLDDLEQTPMERLRQKLEDVRNALVSRPIVAFTPPPPLDEEGEFEEVT